MNNDLKETIDNMSYQEMLSLWRFEPCGSVWFQGELGDYFTKAIANKRKLVGDEEHSATSKRLGWK
jgi:hypothetical protein